MKKSLLAVVVLAASLAGASRAVACSVCACGDPLLAGNDPAAIAGQLRLQLDSEYLTVSAASEEMPGATDQLTQWSARFNAVYRPLERLSLLLTVPATNKSMSVVGHGLEEPMSSLTGLGDVELAARATAWKSVSLSTGRVHEVGFSAGTGLPTGASGAVDSAGMRYNEHAQVGTGSFSPFGGVHYHFEQRQWLALASLSGRARTVNSYGYRYGAALLWSLHGQYRVIRPLALDLGLDGRAAAADASEGVAVNNTGGTVLSLAPGAYFNVAGKVWLFVRAQLPVFQRLSGEQAVGPTASAGLQFQAL